MSTSVLQSTLNTKSLLSLFSVIKVWDYQAAMDPASPDISLCLAKLQDVSTVTSLGSYTYGKVTFLALYAGTL